MDKQTLRLENADGSFRCWLAPLEVERHLRNKTARRIVEKGKPVRYRMISFPSPSDSQQNAAQITASEMRMLPAFSERELKRLARECHESGTKGEPQVIAKLKLIQRWLGHGLIAKSEKNAPLIDLIAGA